MECDGQNLLSFWTSDGYNLYFSFWAMFCTFTSPNDPKKQNSKFKIQKKKKKNKKLKIKKKKKKKKKTRKKSFCRYYNFTHVHHK